MNTIERITAIRKELHSIPECSGTEIKTKDLIKQFLEKNTALPVRDYQGGILAFYDAGKESDTIALRADFDAVALPNGSAKHLCGHDGHTAALLGVALEIEEKKPDRNVLLIFQHAEETGEGAKAMAEALGEYRVNEIYGCHNLPGYPLGTVYTSYDTFACASCGMIVSIQGEPAHAAYPENGKSPMGAVGELFRAIEETRSSTRFSEDTFATLIGSSIGQKAFGTSAENAEVWITVRSDTEKEFAEVRAFLEQSVKAACERDGLTYQIELQDVFPATLNDRECARNVLRKCNGKLLPAPMRWSEDFGHYLGETKGAFFGIGAGECPNLHTMDYEYPDELLPYQIEAFARLIYD